MPGSSNDPPRPPAAPPLAIDDRKRESEAKPIKKPRSEVITPKKVAARTAPVPEAPIAKKPKQVLAIKDKSEGESSKPKKPKIVIDEKPVPTKIPAKKTNLKQKKVVIEIMDPAKKTTNELKEATKAAVQRILSNRAPSRSKPQIITRDIAGLRRELEDVLEQTAKRRTGMSIKDMEIRRGVKA